MVFRKLFSPPAGFKTESLSCFPTDEKLFGSDWEAVMESKVELREWSQSDWPTDTFTKEDNRKDLQLHVEDNANHEAYGYMLYNPDRTFCHGSVYVNPPESLREDYTPHSGDIALLDTLQIRVEYWIRSSPESDSLEISRHIMEWICSEWKVPACFSARESMSDRKKLYQRLGLKQDLVLKNNDSGNLLHLYSL